MSSLSVLCYINENNGFPPWLLSIVQQHFIVVSDAEFNANEAKFADDIVAIFNFHGKPKITKDLVSKLPNLKIVACCGAGYNHIDVKMVRSFNVRVSNAPNVLNDTVADMAMLLLMSAGRKLTEYVSIAKSHSGSFPANNVSQMDIHSSTLGIVGMGRIGCKIAQRAKAFNMKILYHNRNKRGDDIQETLDATYYETVDEMLPLCDYVMVSVCLTPDTTKMFGNKLFELMKPTSVFVNISRGPVVDHDALVDALKSGQIGYAALDVTDPEPLPVNHPLLSMNNVIVTPHCSSATRETRKKMISLAVDNVLAAINGGAMPSEVFD